MREQASSGATSVIPMRCVNLLAACGATSYAPVMDLPTQQTAADMSRSLCLAIGHSRIAVCMAMVTVCSSASAAYGIPVCHTVRHCDKQHSRVSCA